MLDSTSRLRDELGRVGKLKPHNDAARSIEATRYARRRRTRCWYGTFAATVAIPRHDLFVIRDSEGKFVGNKLSDKDENLREEC